LDGFGTGAGQTRDAPFGHAGHSLHEWMFATRSWKQRVGEPGGSDGVDDAFVQSHDRGIGAEIMGAGKYGYPGWHEDADWTGWWGPNPPFHTPVFVLTHHTRPSIEMEGGTTFHFVTDGIEAALARAREAAGANDVRIGGGVATIRAYLRAGLIDELHLALTPALLGSGEALLAGIDLPALGFVCTRHVASADALHVVLARQDQRAP
jgi:dihydrofolate reductase